MYFAEPELAEVPAGRLLSLRVRAVQRRYLYRTGDTGGIRNSPNPVLVASGEVLEGDIDLMSTTLREIDRREDLLVLWSHGVTIDRTGGAALSGVIFLPKH